MCPDLVQVQHALPSVDTQAEKESRESPYVYNKSLDNAAIVFQDYGPVFQK